MPVGGDDAGDCRRWGVEGRAIPRRGEERGRRKGKGKGKGKGKRGGSKNARKMVWSQAASRENNTNKCTVGLNRARKNEDVLGLWMEGRTPPLRAPPCLPPLSSLCWLKGDKGAQVSPIVAQLIGQDGLLRASTSKRHLQTQHRQPRRRQQCNGTMSKPPRIKSWFSLSRSDPSPVSSTWEINFGLLPSRSCHGRTPKPGRRDSVPLSLLDLA